MWYLQIQLQQKLLSEPGTTLCCLCSRGAIFHLFQKRWFSESNTYCFLFLSAAVNKTENRLYRWLQSVRVSTSPIILLLVLPNLLFIHIRNLFSPFLPNSPGSQGQYQTGRKGLEVLEKLRILYLSRMSPRSFYGPLKPTFPCTSSSSFSEISSDPLPFSPETLIFPVQSFKVFTDAS